jgi:hypothetical protein
VTEDEAIARIRARWDHAPLDRRDVEERVALRIVDRDVKPETVILENFTACLLFVRRGPEDWRKRYVHSIYDVDGALDLLEAA